MIRYFYLLVCGVVSLSILVGCAVPSPSFSDMSQVYQSEVEKYQNNNLLLNIVRASKNMPLSFLDIPNVIGTGSLSETAGLGAFIYGGAPSSIGGFFSPTAPSAYMTSSYYNPSASISVGRSFNFTLSSLQNAQFEKGFLQKIPMEVVHYFTSDHVSKELLFLLLIDRFEFLSPDGTITELTNNPLLPNYNLFQEQLRKLINGGLTTEVVVTPMKLGPPLSPTQVTEKNGLVGYLGLAEKNIILKDVSGGAQKQFQLFQMISSVRFCFEKTDYQSEVVRYFGEEMLCANPLGQISEKTQNKSTKNIKTSSKDSNAKPLAISLRSTKDVFQYLGEVVQVQNGSSPKPIGLRKWVEGDGGALIESKDMAPLFVATTGRPKDKVIASVDYEGLQYSIPASDNGYSVYVINLLSQLVNLLKIPGSIPASPAVLIK